MGQSRRCPISAALTTDPQVETITLQLSQWWEGVDLASLEWFSDVALPHMGM